LRVRLYQGEEAFAGKLDDFSVLPCPNTRHCTTTRKDVDFTGELTGPDNQKKRFDCACRPNSLQFARNDDKKWNGPVPSFDQDLAAANCASAAVLGNTCDLRRSQCRKDLLGTRSGQRKWSVRFGHTYPFYFRLIRIVKECAKRRRLWELRSNSSA